MGSTQKAREFLEASETHGLYSSIIGYVLAYFTAKAERAGNHRFADDLKRANEEYKEDFERAMEITEEVYSEIFTDEELDELIVMHTTPAIEKLRGLTSAIMSRVLEKYSLRTP